MTRKMVMAMALPVAAAAIAVGLVAGNRSVETPKKTASATIPSTAPETGGGLVEFRDDAHGFAISYPAGWIKLDSSDAEVALVVSERQPADGRGGSILARVVDTGVVIGPDHLTEAKKFTDQVVASGQGVELEAEPAQITQGGLPGWLYFYTFIDPASGAKGAHTHYFLFKDKLMISLVFQGLPEDEFVRLAQAKLFDRVANSFRLL